MAKFSFKALGLRYCFITFLILFVVPNLIIGVTTELSFDESYYWLFSRYLDFGYFDHPPMVALSIFLGTTIFGHNEFGVRFFSNLYLIGTVFIIWDLVKVYKQPLIFWVLMFSMPLIGLSGMVALPDTPLMFFTTLFFWVIKRYLAEDTTKWAGILALVIAAMFYSKYHGLLIVLLTVCGYPAFLKRKSFWMIVISVVVLFFPHIYWQYMNDFVSFRFHLFGRTEKHFEIKNILDYIGGQIFLMGFLNFFLICFVFYKNKFTDKFERILIFNSFGFLVFLFFMSFRNQIEANWTISCSIALVILMTKYLAEFKRFVLPLAIVSIFFHISGRVVLLNLDYVVNKYSGENRLNEIVGWKGDRIDQIISLCGERKIVGDNYQITSKLAFYTKNKAIPALHLGSRESQYSLLKLQKSILPNEEICYLTSKNLKNSFKIVTNYKDPVYVIQNTTLEKLGTRYGMSYAQIIRD